MSSSNNISRKLIVSFLLILVLVGVGYVLTTFYFVNNYFKESTQKLNANVAQHLIDEKFQNESPFINDSINKGLFGDVMHDMMAVNRAIEVYMLDDKGEVLYSVVLDHDRAEKEHHIVDLGPIKKFIETKGQEYIVGTDPREPNESKIFSAASYEVNGKSGYVYIILAGQAYEDVTNGLLGGYFVKLGLGFTIVSILFSVILAIVAIRYLTRNLREIIFTTKRFKEGDLTARVEINKNTELKDLADNFNQMADQIVSNINDIKSVEKLRQELIANISHDLRSPLAVIQGYAETLSMKLEELSPDEKENYLNTILRSTTKLNKLVQQLFDYSKLEAQQVTPTKEPFIITELVSDLFSQFEVIAKQKGIALKLEIDEKIPLVFADIGLVDRAIQNVLDNALKYTPDNGVVVLKIDTNEGFVNVSVKDSGPGISLEDQKLIFERYKVIQKTSGSGVSTGLGLAITKKIMDLHSATINVISKPTDGTTFQLLFPIHTAAV